jgi:hypothetical protein
MDLRLDDDGAASEPLGDRPGLRRLQYRFSGGHRHAVLRKNLFGLILVNFHMRETANRTFRGLSASSCWN